jgi:hypothetical protein
MPQHKSQPLESGLIESITLQPWISSLPESRDLDSSDHSQIYAADKPRFYPLPILKSTTFFPSIDYSFPNNTFCPSEQFTTGSLRANDVPLQFLTDTALMSQTEAFELPKRDGISKSAFDLDPVSTSASITPQDLPEGVDTSWTSSTTIASLPMITTLLPRGRNVPDDPATWDATMSLPARNTSLEDIIAAGMQVLLFNRPSPSNNQNLITSFGFPSFALPSPYLNILDIPRTRTLTACIHNARSMGLKVSDVIKPFCIAPSLFYRPHCPNDDPVALLASVSDPKVPANLRPTLAQVLYQHPAFIDLIPLPGFRSRVILSAVKTGWANLGLDGFDLFELKRDIFQDGLAWTSYDGCDRQWEKAEPWDIRGWKASEWFVRKWKGLVDEIVHISP